MEWGGGERFGMDNPIRAADATDTPRVGHVGAPAQAVALVPLRPAPASGVTHEPVAKRHSPVVSVESDPALYIYKAGTGPLEQSQKQNLEQNAAAVYLAGLSAGSRRAMRHALDTIAGLLTAGQCPDALQIRWAAVRFQHTAAVRAALAERYAPATANRMISALRGTLKAAWRLGQMSAEDLRRACDVGSVLGESLPAGRALSPGEIAALIGACQQQDGKDGDDKKVAAVRLLGARDAALLALLYGCGLRRAEVVALQMEDYQAAADGNGATLRVRGKRSKQRLVPLVGGAASALADWLALRGEGAGPLFCPFRKGGRLLVGAVLTTQAVYKVLLGRAGQAQVAHLSPHDFRRTFVGDLLDRGADIVTVQKLAGHANVATTARYDRRGEAVKRRAAELLHVPYQPNRSNKPM